ncbi:MAG: DUF5320 domain-containing protein [Clostridiales bacterium]|nr:DUF5320 domain-containing protein [Clostridiales bacterium]
MPRGDGTGPKGAGSMTGRGLGLGLACRRGFGRGFGRGLEASSQTQKELLSEQKTILQERLEAIDKELENL